MGARPVLAGGTPACFSPFVGMSAEVEATLLETDFARKLAGYKSDADVDAYLRCWQDDRNLRELYEKKYRPLVHAAAAAANIPYPILACLFFRESGYDKDIRSHARPPAVGIAQMMPETWTSMTGLLSGTAKADNPSVPKNLRAGVPSDGKPLDLTVKAIEAIYAKVPKGGSITDVDTFKRMQMLLTDYIKYRPEKKKLAKSYLNYFRDVRAHAEMMRIFGEYRKAAGGKISTDSRNDPIAAIGVGAAYAKAFVFDAVIEKDGRYRYPSYDRWIIATGAYNSGPGASKCDEAMTAEECIAATSVLETKRHMAAIRNCSEQGNDEPMNKGEGPGCYK